MGITEWLKRKQEESQRRYEESLQKQKDLLDKIAATKAKALRHKQEEKTKNIEPDKISAPILIPTSPNDFGIKLDSEGQRQENEKFREIADSVIDEIVNCGFFKQEKIPFLAEKINKITVPGYGFSDPFSYDDFLSLEEKKALGLNTRQKFSREYVDCLSSTGLKQENAKDIIKNIWYRKFSAVQSKYNRLTMEAVGITMYIWEMSGDERVKPSCKKMDGKLCLWADPTVYSQTKGKDWIPRPKGASLTHPGEEDGCRCTAIAYQPELLDEL
jgi:hypothetical protein